MVKCTFIIISPDRPVALAIQTGSGTPEFYYLCKDHLGLKTGVMNTSGNIVEEYNYDAWGRRRNPTNWTFNNVPDPALLDRGFTGHEHLDKLGLINMNGRMYDPILGRFLGVDPVIQMPDNSQSFNGYSYCLNNQLKFIDFTGFSAAAVKIRSDCFAKFLAQVDIFTLDFLSSSYGSQCRLPFNSVQSKLENSI